MFPFRLMIKVVRVDNRVFLALTFIMAFAGAALVGDWQAIGHDPCSSADLGPLNTSTNGSVLNENDFTNSNGSGVEMLFSGSGIDEQDSLHQHYVDKCQAMSTSSHQCFYNPTSRVTGEYCNTCLPRCLSEQRSLNFYQYCVGVLLLSFAAPLGYVFNSAIASDLTQLKSQVIVYLHAHIKSLLWNY